METIKAEISVRCWVFILSKQFTMSTYYKKYTPGSRLLKFFSIISPLAQNQILCYLLISTIFGRYPYNKAALSPAWSKADSYYLRKVSNDTQGCIVKGKRHIGDIFRFILPLYIYMSYSLISPHFVPCTNENAKYIKMIVFIMICHICIFQSQ